MYREISKGAAWDGDIICIIERRYDDSIVSSDWSTHFVRRAAFYRIDKITNNGSIIAHNFKRRLRNTHISAVSAVYRRAAV